MSLCFEESECVNGFKLVKGCGYSIFAVVIEFVCSLLQEIHAYVIRNCNILLLQL